MVTLALALQITVIAEGAQTETEVARLRFLGCDLAQGDHFGLAETAEATEAAFGLNAGTRAEILPIEAVEVTPLAPLPGR